MIMISCPVCLITSLCRARAGEDTAHVARQLVLGFLNAPPGRYDVIFTAGATDSLRLLAESFEWRGAQFLYTVANHTYVLTTPACTILLRTICRYMAPLYHRPGLPRWCMWHGYSDCVRPFEGWSSACCPFPRFDSQQSPYADPYLRCGALRSTMERSCIQSISPPAQVESAGSTVRHTDLQLPYINPPNPPAILTLRHNQILRPQEARANRSNSLGWSQSSISLKMPMPAARTQSDPKD